MSGEHEGGETTEVTNGGTTGPSADLAALAADLTKRIGLILESVQSEADRMLVQAQEDARRLLEQERRTLGSSAAGDGPAAAAAAQMAAAGVIRAQVEAHLRSYFRIAEPAPILDRLFGAGSGGEARAPWAIGPAAERET